MWIKLSVFGELLRGKGQESDTSKRGPRNMLEQLPRQFTLQDAIRVRLQNAMKEEGTGNMLSQWKRRGYIEQLADGSYQRIVTDDK